MNKSIQVIFHTFICSVLFCTITAQQSAINTDDVQVVKSFENDLKKTERIFSGPRPSAVHAPDIDYKYNLQVQPVEIDYPTPYIRPIAMKPEAKKHFRQGYLSALYGSLSNPQIDAGYDIYAQDYYNLGLHFSYLGFNDREIPLRDLSKIHGIIEADYFLTRSTLLSLNLGYNNDKHSFFGFNDTLDLERTIDDRNISSFHFGGSIEQSLGDQSSIGAEVFVKNIKTDDISVQENSLKALGVVKSYLGKQKLSLKGGLDYTFLNDSLDDSRFKHLVLYPSLLLHPSKRVALMLGANMIYDSEQFHFFPDVKLSLFVKESKLEIFGGVTGNLKKHSLQNLITDNPYFNGVFGPSNNVSSIDAFLGAEYNGNHRFSGSIQMGYRQDDQMYFFQNDSSNPLVFTTLIDNVSSPYLEINSSYNLRHNIHLNMNILQRFISSDALEKPLYMPQSKVRIGAVFGFFEQSLEFGPELFYKQGTHFISLSNELGKTEDLYDFNFVAKITFKNQFKIHFRAINLLHQEYERWHGYRDYGRHISGGFSVVF